MAILWHRFVELIQAHHRFVLTSHVRPDCDALGSELGLARVLDSLGKHVDIIHPDEVPQRLRFLDPTERVQTLGPAHQRTLADADALIVVDTSAWQQLGDMADVLRQSSAKKIILDHHRCDDDLGAEVFKDIHAESTGGLVVEAAEHLGVTLTKAMAEPLWAAMMTDTGSFRFNSTTGTTLRKAAKLLDAGARPDEFYQRIYEQNSLARIQLIGRVLARTELLLDGTLGLATAYLSDFEETGSEAADTEDLVNRPLSIQGTLAAILLVELPPGDQWKISFRSRDPVDIRLVAEQFHGGGHKNAAGARITGPFAVVREQVVHATRIALSHAAKLHDPAGPVC